MIWGNIYFLIASMLLKPSNGDKSTGSYNLIFCTAVSCVVPKRELKRKELSSDTSKSLLQQVITACFLTIACMLSAILVHYCLASFLIYKSPFGFQTSVMEGKKNPNSRFYGFGV